MKNMLAVLLGVLILAACSKNDKIKILMDNELQGSGEHVTKVEEISEAGTYCKMMKITTDKGKKIIALFRFKNGSLDERFHPNFTVLRYESELLPARDSAMCN